MKLFNIIAETKSYCSKLFSADDLEIIEDESSFNLSILGEEYYGFIVICRIKKKENGKETQMSNEEIIGDATVHIQGYIENFLYKFGLEVDEDESSVSVGTNLENKNIVLRIGCYIKRKEMIDCTQCKHYGFGIYDPRGCYKCDEKRSNYSPINKLKILTQSDENSVTKSVSGLIHEYKDLLMLLSYRHDKYEGYGLDRAYMNLLSKFCDEYLKTLWIAIDPASFIVGEFGVTIHESRAEIDQLIEAEAELKPEKLVEIEVHKLTNFLYIKPIVPNEAKVDE